MKDAPWRLQDDDYAYDHGSTTGRGVVIAAVEHEFEYLPWNWVMDYVATNWDPYV